MKEEIILMELFSGIGGFHYGLTQAGFKIKKCYFSEIDKHAIANYKYNFKDAEYIGSVRDVRPNTNERPDIITFGSPCQDFSVAGKGLGMEGQRSVLILEAIRIIMEQRPGVFIWENVKGSFSSNDGADFWGIMQAFANIGGYRLEWQLLNTSWFLPQNRERIYLIGHLAEPGRNFKGVFPFRESDQGTFKGLSNTPIVRAITAGGHSGGQHSGMTLISDSGLHHQWKEETMVPPLRSNTGAGHGNVIIKGPICVAQRGINPDNPSDRTTGSPTEQTLEVNSQGIANTITSVQKDNLIMQPPSLRIKDYSKDMPQGQRVYETDGISTSINSSGGGLGAITGPYEIGTNIRRLTEIEVERLQGFPDNWTQYGNYDGTIKKIPKTQRYKLCGNAITTNVMKAIGERLRTNYEQIPTIK